MKLTPVTDRDAQFLYDLLKERPAKANISHRTMPSMREHQAFIDSEPYTAWYVIADDQGRRCGSVYLTDRDEIGVHVLAAERGKGYGRFAVDTIIYLNPRKRFLANIAPGNKDSQRFFMGMAFDLVQLTFERRG